MSSVMTSISTWNPATEVEKTAVYLGSHPTPLPATVNGRTFYIWTEAVDEPAEAVEVHIAVPVRTGIVEATEPEYGLLPSWVYA
jgi:hypothetical protein